MTKFLFSVLCQTLTLQTHCRAGDKMDYLREYEMQKVEDWKTTNAQNSISVIVLCAKHLFSTTVFWYIIQLQCIFVDTLFLSSCLWWHTSVSKYKINYET